MSVIHQAIQELVLLMKSKSKYNAILQLFLNSNQLICNREIASDSDIREFPVKHKDIIVLSSDGMYDVVPDHVIEKIVNNHNDKVSLFEFKQRVGWDLI